MNTEKIDDLAKFPSENPNPVLRVSKDKIIYINKAGNDLLNAQANDPIPEKLLECINKAITTNSTVSLETEFDNQIFVFNITPIENEEYLNIYGMNITERKKAEEELRLHSEIMTNMTEGVYLIRLEDGIIVYANPRFEEMFGYDPGEMIGQYVSIVNAPTDKTPEDTKKEIVGILEETREWHGEVNNIKKDGTPFWCYANVSLFDHPEYGKVIVSVHTDITERKKADEALKASEVMLQKSQEIGHIGSFEMNLATNEVIWSDQLYKLFGLKKEGRTIDYEKVLALIHPDDRERAIKVSSDATKDLKPYTLEHRVIHPDGKILDLLITGDVIRNEKNEIVKIGGTAQDITERKKVEDELKKSEDLFREAYQRAEIYKDLFAHDISNILQNIKSSTGLLSIWQKKPDDPQKLTEVISIVNNQVFRGAKLITNIRKLSQIDEETELIGIDPFSKLDEAIKFLKKSYSGKQIEIKIITQINEAKIMANDLLLDIYENLMINSVKYNRNPTIEIKIKVSKFKEDNLNYLKFEFIDNGIGISDSMKEGIFNGTTKRENKSKGMGLGLILVRKIILSYNGKIWVEDKVKGDPSQGSNFVVLLLEVK